MREETFLMSARLFVKERTRLIGKLASIGDSDEIIRDIKAAITKGALPEYRDATVVYLNAIINGSRRIFGLVKNVCGKELFQKLLDAGLKKV